MKNKNIEINGIPSRLFKNIPDKVEAQTPTALTAALRRVVDIIPPEPFEDYRKDTWDFSELMVHCNTNNNRIVFSNAPKGAKRDLKDHALWLLDSGNRVPTVSKRISIIITLLSQAIAATPSGRYETLTADSFLSVIDEKHIQPDIKRLYTRYIHTYYAWLTERGESLHLVNCGALKRAIRKYAQQAKFRRVEHYPDIPEPLYMAIRNRMEKLLYDKKAPLRDRMIAGMQLVTSQTGLRHSETPALKTNCRETVAMPDGSERTVIDYWRIKRSRNPTHPDLQKTICTELASRAIDEMLKLRRKIVREGKGEFLAVLPGMDGSRPISLDTYGDAYKAVLIKYVPECNLDWPPIKRVKENSHKRVCKTYSVPVLHSYRVHFISSLYKAGVPIPYIEHLVAHKPGEIETGYYGGVQMPHNELLDE